MATSLSARQIKPTQNPIPFSQSEIEAAKQLIQLSSGDSEEDHHSSSNSCSYSVVQGKPPQQSKVDSGGDVSSVAVTTAVESEDESFARKNKRYRCIKDLYSATTPVVKAKRKRNKCVGTRK
ncbi:hypothetical protein AAZX31_08G075300 [Glycine max]|nr:hypothetical protein GLYMA_08G077602v4 [Glycine max]KAH1050151.1 hypothetical protein GYH30_020565 [Glycine max]